MAVVAQLESSGRTKDIIIIIIFCYFHAEVTPMMERKGQQTKTPD
jgi:hypothetical protein